MDISVQCFYNLDSVSFYCEHIILVNHNIWQTANTGHKWLNIPLTFISPSVEQIMWSIIAFCSVKKDLREQNEDFLY